MRRIFFANTVNQSWACFRFHLASRVPFPVGGFTNACNVFSSVSIGHLPSVNAMGDLCERTICRLRRSEFSSSPKNTISTFCENCSKPKRTPHRFCEMAGFWMFSLRVKQIFQTYPPSILSIRWRIMFNGNPRILIWIEVFSSHLHNPNYAHGEANDSRVIQIALCCESWCPNL